ncbi:ankyrin repeat protein, partial [Zopfochytrium polystomum]
MTPLVAAVHAGQLEVAAWLLEGGAAIDKTGASPLHLAAKTGKVEVVECLLLRGADGNAKTSAAVTPLCAAIANGHDHVVKIFLEKRACVEGDYSELIAAAAASGSMDSVQL